MVQLTGFADALDGGSGEESSPEQLDEHHLLR